MTEISIITNLQHKCFKKKLAVSRNFIFVIVILVTVDKKAKSYHS